MAVVNRIPLEQTFFNVPFAVTLAPTPISTTIQLSSMLQSFVISNPSANVNSVFWGDPSMTTSADGIEIKPGSAPQFLIQNTRQLYELQDPELASAQVALCASLEPVSIPVICWNPINFFLVGSVAGPTNVVISFFRTVYV